MQCFQLRFHRLHLHFVPVPQHCVIQILHHSLHSNNHPENVYTSVPCFCISAVLFCVHVQKRLEPQDADEYQVIYHVNFCIKEYI